MALLLDRLAKENQDIRLLQAQLQVGTRGRVVARLALFQPGVYPLSSPKEVVFANPPAQPSPVLWCWVIFLSPRPRAMCLLHEACHL